MSAVLLGGAVVVGVVLLALAGGKKKPGATANGRPRTEPSTTPDRYHPTRTTTARMTQQQLAAAILAAPLLWDTLQGDQSTNAGKREATLSFQRVAPGLAVDGKYGPRSAGALAYLLEAAADTARLARFPRPYTTDKRLVRYVVEFIDVV